LKPLLVNMFLTGFVLVTHLAFSQQKVDYDYKLFDYKQGFQQSNVFDIAEGENGFFWLATEKGLVRFDGINFLDFNPSNPVLTQARINRLYRYKNLLYLMYDDIGCVQFDMNTYTFKEVTLLKVADLLHIDDSELIILFANGVLEKRVKDKPTCAKKLPTNLKGQLHVWNKQLVVAVPDYGICFLDAQTLEIKTRIVRLKKFFYRGFESNADNLYFIEESIAFELNKSFEVKRMFGDLSSKKNEINYFKYINAKEQLYIKNAKSVVQIHNNIATDLPITGYKNLQLIVIAPRDSAGYLIGTNQGLLRVTKKEVTFTSIDDNYVKEKNDRIRVRRKILPYKKNQLMLLGQPYSYIYDIKTNVFQDLLKISLPIYNACLVGDDLYAATEGRGLQKINMHTRLSSDIVLESFQRTETYLSILHDQQQNKLLLGGYKGSVFEYDLNTGKAAMIKTPFLTGFVKQILKDTVSKNYWFATSEGLYYSDAKYENWGSVGSLLKSVLVAALVLDNSGRKLWVARNNGLELIDLNRNKIIETIENPVLSEDKIFSMLQDKMGRIWLGTFNGITAYDPQTHSFKKLGKKNQLINKEFNYTSAAVLPDGNLIFGGLTGYDIIYPDKFNFKESETKGVITGYYKFNATDTTFNTLNNPNNTSINFYTDEDFVRVYFSCSKVIKASDFNYEYSLDGGPWLKVNNSGFMDIAKLRQGEYTLQFRSYDEYGNDIYFKKATLNVMLPFYKTYTFLATLFFAIISLSFLLTRSLKRTSAKENQLKQQIAMDLHDEVGTILTRTLYILGSESATAAQKFDSHGNSTVAKNIGEALFSLRTYINTINISFFTLNDLYDEISELLQSQQFSFNYQITTSKDKSYPISSPVFRDTKLSLFEIIANIQKYASASNVTIRLVISDQKLILYVTDDGQLNDISVLHQAKGNGIKNLQKRVQKHHGKVHFWVLNKGSGLCILMYFNLK
jgi:hypothetical protein